MLNKTVTYQLTCDCCHMIVISCHDTNVLSKSALMSGWKQVKGELDVVSDLCPLCAKKMEDKP